MKRWGAGVAESEVEEQTPNFLVDFVGAAVRDYAPHLVQLLIVLDDRHARVHKHLRHKIEP